MRTPAMRYPSLKRTAPYITTTAAAATFLPVVQVPSRTPIVLSLTSSLGLHAFTG